MKRRTQQEVVEESPELLRLFQDRSGDAKAQSTKDIGRLTVSLVKPLPAPYDVKPWETAEVKYGLDPGGFIVIDSFLVVWAVADETAAPVQPGTAVNPVYPKNT